jgi:hypothetical protein
LARKKGSATLLLRDAEVVDLLDGVGRHNEVAVARLERRLMRPGYDEAAEPQRLGRAVESALDHGQGVTPRVCTRRCRIVDAIAPTLLDDKLRTNVAIDTCLAG